MQWPDRRWPGQAMRLFPPGGGDSVTPLDQDPRPERIAEAARCLRDLQRRIDADLARGQRPRLAEWKRDYPDLAEEIDEIWELRVALHEEGLLGPDPELPAAELAFVEQVEAMRDSLTRTWSPSEDAAEPGTVSSLETTLRLEAWIAETLAPEASAPGRSKDRDYGIGRFILRGRLGSHPVGAFFRAEEVESGEPVHLLIIRPDVPSDQARALLRDAEAVRGLRLPGIATLLALGEERSVRYVVWELPSGRPLDMVLAEIEQAGGEDGMPEVLLAGGALAELRAAGSRAEPTFRSRLEIAASLARNQAHLEMVRRVTSNVAMVLSRAHAQGQVHFDLAPQHVFLEECGAVTLAAFGLGKHRRGFLADRGVLPVFRAPELFLGEDHPEDWRADIYGLGALLYAMLRLEAPVLLPAESRLRTEVAESFPQTLAERVRSAEPPFGALLRHVLEYDPTRRPASCEAVLETLRNLGISRSQPRQAERKAPWWNRWRRGFSPSAPEK